MIDNIVTNTLLPALSREFLNRSLAKEELKEARVGMKDGQFTYQWRSAAEPPLPAIGSVTVAADTDPADAEPGDTIPPIAPPAPAAAETASQAAE